MLARKIGLLISAMAIIGLYFMIPFYNNWLYLRILNPHLSIAFQARHLDEGERKDIRYGTSYILCTELADLIRKYNINDPLILLPPLSYLQKLNIHDYDVCDPPVFYYYTGIRAVIASSPDAGHATLAIVPNVDNKIIIKKIHSSEDIERLLAIYKPYTKI